MRNAVLKIVSAVAEAYSVPATHVATTRDGRRGRYQGGRLREARYVSMWLARQLTGASYPELGRLFHVDHSSVMHACRKVDGGGIPSADSVIDKIMFPSTKVGNA